MTDDGILSDKLYPTYHLISGGYQKNLVGYIRHKVLANIKKILSVITDSIFESFKKKIFLKIMAVFKLIVAVITNID